MPTTRTTPTFTIRRYYVAVSTGRIRRAYRSTIRRNTSTAPTDIPSRATKSGSRRPRTIASDSSPACSTRNSTTRSSSDYKINGLGAYSDGEGGFLPITVTGWPDTIWLTNQLRKDKDEAVFGEMSFDFTDKLTGTAGLRWYKFDNSLKGFFGYSAELLQHQLRRSQVLASADKQYNGSPCTEPRRQGGRLGHGAPRQPHL